MDGNASEYFIGNFAIGFEVVGGNIDFVFCFVGDLVDDIF